MTRRVHNTTQPPKESSKAWAAWQAYRSMPVGERGLERLCAQFKEQARLHKTNPDVPPPPTTSIDSIKTWSQAHQWQARLVVEQAEADQARREEAQRLAVEQARADCRLAQQVGSGGLSVVAIALNTLVGPQGALQRDVRPRDLPSLVKASLDCLHFAYSGSVDEGGDPNAPLRAVLDDADDDVRGSILRGLQALYTWCAAKEGRRR